MIDKTFKENYYDGCLNEIKQELVIESPPGKKWTSNPLNLIGHPTGFHNVYLDPYTSPPAWMEIKFFDKYILPTGYFLEGRRYSSNQLKSWQFEGRTIYGEWKILHFQDDQQFSHSEPRLFPLDFNDIFTGFKLVMVAPDSNGQWALCPGQIEIFGYIYGSIHEFYDQNPGGSLHYNNGHTIFLNFFFAIYHSID